MNRRKNEKGLAIALVAVLLGALIPFATTSNTDVYAQTTPTDLTDAELEIQDELIATVDTAISTLDVVVDDDDDYTVERSNVAWIDAETASAIFVDCPPGLLPQSGFYVFSSTDLDVVQEMPVGVDEDVASWLAVIENEHSEERKAVIVGVICEGDFDSTKTVVRSGGDSSNVINNIDITNINFITEIRNTINIHNNNTTIINNNTNVTIPDGGGNDTNGNTTDPGTGGNTTDPGTGGNTTDPGTGGGNATLLTAPIDSIEDPGTEETPAANENTTSGSVVAEEETTTPEEEITEETTPPAIEEETNTVEEETDAIEEESTTTVDEEEEETEEETDTESPTDATADDSSSSSNTEAGSTT